MTDKVYLVLFVLREPCTACIYTAKIYNGLVSTNHEPSPSGALHPHKGFPERAIPPQNGGNVGNAIGIERQKGRAARKRSCRVATEEDKKPI